MKKKKKTFFPTVIFFICLAAAGFSAWKLYGFYQGYRSGEKEYEKLAQYVEVKTEDSGGSKGEGKDTCPISVDFESLRAVNDQIVGWVHIPDTGIHYPIVQGTDNEYYLNHTFEKKDNFSGAIYLDASCSPSFTSDNSIVFGHNLKTGEMFGALKKLYDKEYNEKADYREHPVIWIITPESEIEYKIFAAREISVEASDGVYMIDFARREDYQKWIARQKESSQYETDTAVSTGEPMITLSTCTSDSEDGRFVVQAIQVQKTAR